MLILLEQCWFIFYFTPFLIVLLFVDSFNSAFTHRPFKITLLAQIIFGVTELHRVSREIKDLRCVRGFVSNYRVISRSDSQLKFGLRKVSGSWSMVKGNSGKLRKLRIFKTKLERRLMRLVTALIVSSQNRTCLIR